MTQPPDEPGATGAAAIRRFGALFGAVAAPASFVTALLYYFGWHHAYWFFYYFGVNATTLGLGTTDYLMRSLDALFVPMVTIAAIGLVAFWGHDLLRARLAAGYRPHMLSVIVPTMAVVGFLLALGGLWSVRARTFLTPHLALAPLSLASGVILLAYALQLRRALAASETRPASPVAPTTADSTPESASGSTGDTPPAPLTPPDRPPLRPEWAAVAEWGAVFVLVGLSLFWAANDYAAAVGRGRAAHFGATLAEQPTAVLYSERDLAIHEPGVRELRCGDGKSAYGFRYEGLALVIQSADQYVLVPKSWTPSSGVALVLPRTDSVRLEFVPVSAAGTLGRTRC
ncbi:hypothetical protein ACGFSB_21125 [Streptomyces sp. NPDC048441]|uniref:hypothetical protein n=1 Tax=Streptomyces sp. NPDC048441 TaxID=3365552 RepID=UPI00371C1B5D